MADAGESARRILVGLIGYPIQHSASPCMHEAAAKAAGFSLYYHLIERRNLDVNGLRHVLDGVRQTGFSGVNVTFPYKEMVLPLMDELSPIAARIGAVNTILIKEGRLIGHNTDCSGFGAAYAAMRGAQRDKAIALVGAGGVGRAIAVALAQHCAPEIRLFDTDAAKVGALHETLQGLCASHVCTSIEEAIEGVDGIVNATPLGMTPHVEKTAVPVHLIRPHHWVADAVYVPLWTTFLKAAHLHGAKILTGRDFVIAQAADAFRLFTGGEAYREEMAMAFDQFMLPKGSETKAA